MVDTRFKPVMVQYGKRKVFMIKLKHILTLICIISPGTNWLIPLIHTKVKGSLRLII